MLLRKHRDGKHGHADPNCIHPDCREATRKYMQERAQRPEVRLANNNRARERRRSRTRLLAGLELRVNRLERFIAGEFPATLSKYDHEMHLALARKYKKEEV